MIAMIPGAPNSLSASWMTPDPTNGIISGYTVDCSSALQEQISFSFNASERAVTLTNLRAFTNYTCSIYAVTGAGAGNISTAEVAHTDEDGS